MSKLKEFDGIDISMLMGLCQSINRGKKLSTKESGEFRGKLKTSECQILFDKIINNESSNEIIFIKKIAGVLQWQLS